MGLCEGKKFALQKKTVKGGFFWWLFFCCLWCVCFVCFVAFFVVVLF